MGAQAAHPVFETVPRAPGVPLPKAHPCLHEEIPVAFSAALEITTDELLKPERSPPPLRLKPSLRMLRRLEKIESLPVHQPATLLKTTDIFLRGATDSR